MPAGNNMPGLSLVFSTRKDCSIDLQLVRKSFQSLICNEPYYQCIYKSNSQCFIGSTKYTSYPVEFFENEKFNIYCEGKIYNKEEDELENHVSNFVELLTSDLQRDEVLQWLMGADGDFLIVIEDKINNKVFVVNDALGRLPTYVLEIDGCLIITREIRFVIDFLGHNKFDKLGIALGLIFGYPIGDRTYYSGVKRMKPANLITIDWNKAFVNSQILNEFNMEIKRNKDKPFSEIVHTLSDLFLQSNRNRINSCTNPVLSLSGGLDSRAVAAGLAHANSKIKTVSYLDSNNLAELDVKLAKDIAGVLKFPWKLIKLQQADLKDLRELIQLKGGLNNLGMSFILRFFKKLRKDYGENIFYFTGDGGDKTLPDWRPLRKLKNLDDLIYLAIDTEQRSPIETVEKITGIPRSEIMDEIRAVFDSYPEKKLKMKFIRFLIYERAFKFLFEGEDRNRSYFWSVAPFYSVPFFRYAMNIPETYKANYKLYRHFLTELSPALASIPNEKFNKAIISYKFRVFKFFQKIYWLMPLQFLRRKKVTDTPTLNKVVDYELIDIFNDQLKNCQDLKKYFEINELKDSFVKMKRHEFYNLLTITSTIDQYESEESTLDRYALQ